VRVVGLDLGARRVGVALSDGGGTVATPYETIERGRDHTADHARVAAIVEEVGAGMVVVGLPRSLDGSLGPAARLVLDEVDELTAALAVPVDTVDERLTTVTAERSLRVQGRKGKARRAVVDQVAAAVLLQTWLDGPAGRDARADAAALTGDAPSTEGTS
jgi:putative holliday junction resolvase